jgi:hypothetical protein
MKPFGGLHLSGEIFGDTGLRENVAWHMHPERCPPSIRCAPNAANEATLFIRQTFIAHPPVESTRCNSGQCLMA